jgi:drug/metabolite transporter (DMT)-like permease
MLIGTATTPPAAARGRSVRLAYVHLVFTPARARAGPTSGTEGIAAALAAVFLFGATVVLQASLHRRGVGAMAPVGLRYLVAALVCAAVLVAGRRPVLPVVGERGRADMNRRGAA